MQMIGSKNRVKCRKKIKIHIVKNCYSKKSKKKMLLAFLLFIDCAVYKKIMLKVQVQIDVNK